VQDLIGEPAVFEVSSSVGEILTVSLCFVLFVSHLWCCALLTSLQMDFSIDFGAADYACIDAVYASGKVSIDIVAGIGADAAVLATSDSDINLQLRQARLGDERRTAGTVRWVGYEVRRMDGKQTHLQRSAKVRGNNNQIFGFADESRKRNRSLETIGGIRSKIACRQSTSTKPQIERVEQTKW
jgi:hypothetical protein